MKRTMLLLVISMVAGIATAQQNENVFTCKVGKYEVILLSESQGAGNPRILVGATDDMLKQAIPDGTFPNATNAFLIKTPDKVILVDAGYGRLLFDNLKSLGVTPEQIDMILLTHMHGDHIGGMLKDGAKSFPNATVHTATREQGHWNKAGGGAKDVLTAYKDKLVLFLPGEIDKTGKEIYPGITPVVAYGHTPGHTGFLVESEGQKLMIWGDLTHAMAIQMPFPQVAVTYDSNPASAVAYRKQILEYVVKNNIPVAGMHIAYPGMGHVSSAGNSGYQFKPLE